MPIDLRRKPALPTLPRLSPYREEERQARDPSRMPDDLLGVQPTQDQIKQAEDQAKIDAQPWWAYLFSLPDQLLGGRALRGFIRGFGSESDVNPIEGFLRGLPGAELVAPHLGSSALNTSFSDLRKSFGDYESEEGVGNFLVNLVGDIVLDPTTWVMPFAVTAKAATETGLAVSKAADAAGDVASGLTRANRGAVTSAVKQMGLTTEQAVQNGLKSALTFHIPFTDIYKPIDSYFGLKSMNITAARAVDNTMSTMRTSPVLGPMLKMFGGSGIADPAEHASFMRVKEMAALRGEQLSAAHLQMLSKMSPVAQEMLFNSKDFKDVFSILIETGGFAHLDDGGMLEHVIRNRELIENGRNVVSHYEAGGEFAKTLDAAYGGKFDPKLYMQGIMDPTGQGKGSAFVNGGESQQKAIQSIYDNMTAFGDRPMRMDQGLLDVAGLPARPGVDIPFERYKLQEILPDEELAHISKGGFDIGASSKLSKLAQDKIRDAGYSSYDELVAASNGINVPRHGAGSSDTVDRAKVLLREVDGIMASDRLALRDPTALMARREELLARAQVGDLNELQAKRRAVQAAAMDAKKAGNGELAMRYRELQRAYTQMEVEANTIESTMREYATNPSILVERGIISGDKQGEFEALMKQWMPPAGQSEADRIAAKYGGRSLRQIAVDKVFDFLADSPMQTTPELQTVRSRIKELDLLDRSKGLDDAGRTELRGLMKQQRELVRSGAMLGGADLQQTIIEAAMVHRATMKGVATAERGAALINSSLENYLPRIVNPAAKALIDGRFEEAMSSLGVGDAAAAFMQKRKFSDLTTFEANLLMEHVGSKVTNYAALGDLLGVAKGKHEQVKKALTDGAMGWTNVVFGATWTKKYLAPIDPEMAEFFIANPFMADVRRIQASGKAMAPAVFKQAAFASEDLTLGSASMDDVDGVARELSQRTPDQVMVLVNTVENTARDAAVSKVMADITDHALNVREGTMMHVAGEHVRDMIATEKMSADDVLEEIQQARNLVEEFRKNPTIDLAEKAEDGRLLRMSKMQLRNVNDATPLAMTAKQDAEVFENVMRDFRSAENGATAKGYHQRLLVLHDAIIQHHNAAQSAAEGAVGGADELTNLVEQVRETAGSLWDDMASRRKIRKLGENPESLLRSRERFVESVVKSHTTQAVKDVGTEVNAFIRSESDQIGILRSSLAKAELVGDEVLSARIKAVLRVRESELENLKGFRSGDLEATKVMSEKQTKVWQRQRIVTDARHAMNLEETGSLFALAQAKHGVREVESVMASQADAVRRSSAKWKASANESLRATKSKIKMGVRGTKADPSQMADAVRAEMNAAQGIDFGLEHDTYVDWDAVPESVKASVKGNKDLRLVRMNRDVYEAINGHMKDMSRPDTMKANSLIRGLDYVRDWWSAMTTMNPLFVQTRAGDVVQTFGTLAASGNLSVGALRRSYKISRALGRAMRFGTSLRQELGNQTTAFGGEERLLADVVEELQSHGTLGKGLAADILPAGLMDSPAGRVVEPSVMDHVLGIVGISNPRGKVNAGTGTLGELARESAKAAIDPKNNPVYRMEGPYAEWLGRGAARLGDDTARLTAALGAMEQGMDVAGAAAHAKQWTYGSGANYSSVERNVLKRFIPFYGFMKWSTGAAVELMTQNPKYLGAVSKVRDNAYKANGLSQTDMDGIAPQFLSDNTGIPVVNTPDGPVFLAMGRVMPYQALADVSSAARTVLGALGGSYVMGTEQKPAGDAALYIARNLHPAAKLFVETLVKRDMFSGRDLERYPGERVEMFGISMPAEARQALRNLRLLNDLDRLNIFDVGQLKVAANAVPRGQTAGDRAVLPSWAAAATSSFSPVPLRAYQVDMEEDLRRKRAKDQAEINQLKGYMRQQVDSPKPQAEKNVEVLQRLIANKVAENSARQRAEIQYRIDPAAEDKARRERLKSRQGARISLTRSGYRE